MRHLVIVGRPGMGKSSLARWILSRSNRIVVLDILRKDYDDGVIFYSFDDASRFFLSRWRETFRIICRFREPWEWEAMVNLVYHTNELATYDYEDNDGSVVRPIGVVFEEAAEFTQGNQMPEWLVKFWTLGRHWSVYAVAISQTEVQLATIVRRNSDIVFFRSHSATPETVRTMPSGTMDRIIGLEEYIYSDERTDPPKPDLNYIVVPEPYDVMVEWDKVFSGSESVSSPGLLL